MNTGLRHVFTALAGLTLAAPLAAQDFGSGRLQFDYDQFPSGSYAGTFFAEGSVLDPGTFPPFAPGAVHAAHIRHDGMYIILVVGGFRNADSSGDVAFLYLRSEEPFAAGTYIVDPVTYSVMFGFVDDARAVEIPEEPWAADWEAIFDTIEASHKMGAVSGVIELDVVEDDRVVGSFAGFMAEPDGVRVVVSDAAFSTGAVVLPVESKSWARIKAAYRD